MVRFLRRVIQLFIVRGLIVLLIAIGLVVRLITRWVSWFVRVSLLLAHQLGLTVLGWLVLGLSIVMWLIARLIRIDLQSSLK